jgi:hypothetical protein
LDTAFPHPCFDEFEVNPFVMTFETEGEKNVARSFRPASRKNRANIGLLTKARPSDVADDSHKTLTQRADYSSMTAEIGAKMRATKQRIK